MISVSEERLKTMKENVLRSYEMSEELFDTISTRLVNIRTVKVKDHPEPIVRATVQIFTSNVLFSQKAYDFFPYRGSEDDEIIQYLIGLLNNHPEFVLTIMSTANHYEAKIIDTLYSL